MKTKKLLIIALLLWLPIFLTAKQKTIFSLKDAINRALSTSFELKKTKMKERLYTSLMSEYLREYFPKVGVGISKEAQRVERAPDTRKTRLDFSLQQLIFDGGRISHAREVAKIEKRINRYDSKDIKRATITQVVSEFFKILSIKRKIKLQKEFLENIKKQTNLSKVEFNLGEITKLDYLEIKTKLHEEKFALKNLEKELELTSRNFKLILKLDSNETLQLRSDFFEKFTEMKDIKKHYKLNELVDVSYIRTKQFAKIALAYKKAKNEMELVKKSYIPTISLVGNYSLEGEGIPRDKSYNVGLVFNFSFGGNSSKTNYDAGKFNNSRGQRESIGTQIGILDNISSWGSQYMEKNLALQEIIYQKRNYKSQLETEIKSIYTNLSNSVDGYEIGKTKKDLIIERVRLSQLKHKLGELKRLDVINVELELLKSKLELINSITGFLLGTMQLETKIGVPIGYLNLYKLEI